MTPRNRRALAVIAAASFAFTASCGGGDDDDAAPDTTASDESSDATDAAPASSAATSGTTGGTTGGTAAGSDASGGDVDDCGIENSVIDAAKEEGEVVYFSPAADDQLQETANRFKDAYGINVSANRQPTGDLIQQVDTALEAGSVPADVVSLSEPSGFITWTEEGVVKQFDIPNVDDIIDGLHDPARYSYPTTFLVFGIMYNEANTDAADLPTSWAEFPEQVGDHVTAWGNPGSSGSALANWYGIESELGTEYLDGFTDKENLVTDSSLTLNQLVLTGEADFAVPGIESEILRAAGTGEPLRIVYPEDFVPVVTGEIGILADSPHPNAALVFAQWMMCSASQDQTHTNGYRPALSTSPVPEGVPDLAELTLVPVDVPDLVERRQELVEAFDAALG